MSYDFIDFTPARKVFVVSLEARIREFRTGAARCRKAYKTSKPMMEMCDMLAAVLEECAEIMQAKLNHALNCAVDPALWVKP